MKKILSIFVAIAALTAIEALQSQGIPHARCVVLIEASEERARCAADAFPTARVFHAAGVEPAEAEGPLDRQPLVAAAARRPTARRWRSSAWRPSSSLSQAELAQPRMVVGAAAERPPPLPPSAAAWG